MKTKDCHPFIRNRGSRRKNERKRLKYKRFYTWKCSRTAHVVVALELLTLQLHPSTMRSKRVRSLRAATATAALALLVLMLSPCGVRAEDEYAPSPEVRKVFMCALSFHPRVGGIFRAHFKHSLVSTRPLRSLQLK